MVRRSEFTIVAAVLSGVALLTWTLTAPVDIDPLWVWTVPRRGWEAVTAHTVATLTFPPFLYALALLAALWASRRRLSALAGATVVAVTLAASLSQLLTYFIAAAPASAPWLALTTDPYPSPRVTAAVTLGMTVVTIVVATRRRARLVAAWTVASTLLTAAVAANELYLSASLPTAVIGAVLLGAFAWSAAGLLADVHLLRPLAPGSGAGRAAVIYNPTKVRDLGLLRRTVDGTLAEEGWRPALWLETRIDDPGPGMAESARDAGVDLVLIAGGDGTVRSVCGALVGADVTVALLPLGTGNLLARNLGVPLDLQRALELAIAGVPAPLDLIRVTNLDAGTHSFAAVMAGLGADAAVLKDADERLKNQLGPVAYVLAGLSHIRATPVPVRVTVDNYEPIERDASLVEVGNVGELQAGVSLMPLASASDGLLDVLIASPRHVADVAQMMAGVLTHSTYEPLLDRVRGHRAVVEAQRPVLFQIDGDVVGEVLRIQFDVEPGAVRVKVPPRAQLGQGGVGIQSPRLATHSAAASNSASVEP